jgi:hypothetical protein
MTLFRRVLENTGRAARLGVSRFVLRNAPFVLRLRLTSPVPELPHAPFLGGAEPSLSLLEVLLVLRRAARDPTSPPWLVRSEEPSGCCCASLSLRRGIAGCARSRCWCGPRACPRRSCSRRAPRRG